MVTANAGKGEGSIQSEYEVSGQDMSRKYYPERGIKYSLAKASLNLSDLNLLCSGQM